jgi:flagellar hook-associated protein 1 FlgK
MSLSIARYAAYSAMMTAETQISVSSANIANADTDGYTKKTATQVSTTSNGTGTGTTIAGISGTVDRLLLKSLIQSVSALGAATVTDSYAGDGGVAARRHAGERDAESAGRQCDR